MAALDSVETLEALIRDEAGVLTDSTVVLTVVAPDGTDDTPALVHPSTGRYLYDLALNQRGLWQYTFVSTGAVTLTIRRYIVVGESAAVDHGPCEPWCCLADVLACRSDLAGHEDAVARAIPIASSLLYEMTQHRYPGLCERSRTFCQPCGCGIGRRYGCVCGNRQVLRLAGRYPIAGVLSVTIDGVELAASAWRVDDWQDLVRLDGEAWPRVVDLADADAFVIEWVEGRTVPPGGARAAAIFAANIAAKCERMKCDLPSRVTTVQREQTTYTILDSQRFLDENKTGIYEVDQWLAADKKGRSVVPGMFDPDAESSVHALGT